MWQGHTSWRDTRVVSGPGSSLIPSSGVSMSSAPPSMAQVLVRFVGLGCWRSTCWRPEESLLLPQAPLAAFARKQALLLTLAPQKGRIHSQQGMALQQIRAMGSRSRNRDK